jgi:3-oxoacyl-[acyl-carrier protein] reductase
VNQIDLNHRHAVVTGGTQGLGFSVVARLLESGASVSLSDRDAALLKLAFNQLQDHGVVSVESVDVCHADGVVAATENTISKHERIGVLVASAGIADPNLNLGISSRLMEAGYRHQPYWSLPLLSRDRSSHDSPELRRIVKISSIAGKEGNPTASGHSVSKAGVLAFTKSLGKETALNNIAVNSVGLLAAKTRNLDQVTQEHIDFMLSKIPRERFLKVD